MKVTKKAACDRATPIWLYVTIVGLVELAVSYILVLIENPGAQPGVLPNKFLDAIVKLLCFPVYVLRSLGENLGPKPNFFPTGAYFLAWLFSGLFWGAAAGFIVFTWRRRRAASGASQPKITRPS